MGRDYQVYKRDPKLKTASDYINNGVKVRGNSYIRNFLMGNIFYKYRSSSANDRLNRAEYEYGGTRGAVSKTLQVDNLKKIFKGIDMTNYDEIEEALGNNMYKNIEDGKIEYMHKLAKYQTKTFRLSDAQGIVPKNMIKGALKICEENKGDLFDGLEYVIPLLKRVIKNDYVLVEEG